MVAYLNFGFLHAYCYHLEKQLIFVGCFYTLSLCQIHLTVTEVFCNYHRSSCHI
jgi:hypothetical protein